MSSDAGFSIMINRSMASCWLLFLRIVRQSKAKTGGFVEEKTWLKKLAGASGHSHRVGARTFQSAATSNGRRASGAYWNREKSEGCCGLGSPRSGGSVKMRQKWRRSEAIPAIGNAWPS